MRSPRASTPWPTPSRSNRPPAAGEEVARFACVNNAFERLFGYATRDLSGRTEDLLYAESTNMDNVMHIRDRLALGERCAGSSSCRPAKASRCGSRSPRAWCATQPTIRSTTSRPCATSRRVKEFEAAVAAEKQRLSVTLKAIGDAVITALPDGRIDFINAAAQRLLNVPFGEATACRCERSSICATIRTRRARSRWIRPATCAAKGCSTGPSATPRSRS